ncbi:ankyrin repeat domain-containing protein [Cohnella sp. AR92]|uniref:ankyrin repeat domain-containing protein n=1 Tax=Cohnella sp. AR92 TaxID=648716 RepID=UPI000F8D3175|nr:ankyrin repeat domain-containing protein [Cohnella sp. AR92]RUS47358.1 ankyrin repeat domain-containing protein [Cohnella sp. AR92]
MPKRKSTAVLSIRLDDEVLKAVDLLVESGLESNRSRAVVHFVNVGVRASRDLLVRAREQADNLQRLKSEMFEAVKHRDIDKVAELIHRDASLVNASSPQGETPVLMAALLRANDIKELLLQNGAGRLNVFEAAAVGYNSRVEELLNQSPQMLNSYSHDGFPLLSLAVHFGNTETVELLLSRGVDVHARSRDGSLNNKAIHATVFGGYGHLVDLLMEHGADIHAKCEGELRKGFNVLHVAAYFDKAPLIEKFLGYGADKTEKNANGETPYELAVSLGHTASAELLRV